MAECEECLHNVICELWRKEERQDAESVLTGGLSDCPIYKSASSTIALPCKVGDTVYYVTKLLNNETVIVEGEVFEFCITHERATKDKYRFYFWAKGEEFIRRQYSIWCDFTDFGKTVFLTREEAEAALAERSKK